MNPDCIFCKIVAGTIPNHTVYEDENFLAFLDIHPLSPGHALVIPKEHHRWVWDVEDTATYFGIAKKIALAQRTVFGTEAIQSKVVGEQVPHAHVWVFPDPDTAQGDKADFVGNAEKLRAALL
ncbi:MAG: hypothetical protein RLZZ342_164 [Candidatus Parcubacteria bacterium]|jgi:histidine triad (HIT) family protein